MPPDLTQYFKYELTKVPTALFTEKHFNKSATIAFDEYGNCPPVKDHEHIRRDTTQACPDKDVSEHLPVYKKTKCFLYE